MKSETSFYMWPHVAEISAIWLRRLFFPIDQLINMIRFEAFHIQETYSFTSSTRTFLWNVFVALLMLSFICFSVSVFCRVHIERHSFRMIIAVNKSIFITFSRIFCTIGNTATQCQGLDVHKWGSLCNIQMSLNLILLSNLSRLPIPVS